jgi:pilus assembly protein CpaE
MGLILLADGSDEFARRLTALLEEEPELAVEGVDELDGVGARLEADPPPHVVVTGPSVDHDEALGLSAEIALDHPDVSVVLVVTDVTTEIMRQAMQSGVREVIGAGESYSELVEAVKRAHSSSERYRSTISPAASATESEQAADLGRVITVFSMKGGVGKTVLATNLGVALAKHMDKKVVILDLDLEFGDAAIMMHLAPERTIFDAVQAFDRLDRDMLEGFLSKHDSGVRVLLAPIQPEDAESVTSGRIAHIINLLREMADYVVIDTPATFNETVLAALDKSDEVFAVTMMDVASIKNTKISLQKLLQLGYNGGKVRIVLNRADSKVWLEATEVEKAIEGKIAAKIPSDRVVPRSVNKGVPVVLDDPKSAVAKSIVALAREIAETEGE